MSLKLNLRYSNLPALCLGPLDLNLTVEGGSAIIFPSSLNIVTSIDCYFFRWFLDDTFRQKQSREKDHFASWANLWISLPFEFYCHTQKKQHWFWSHQKYTFVLVPSWTSFWKALTGVLNTVQTSCNNLLYYFTESGGCFLICCCSCFICVSVCHLWSWSSYA